MSVQIHINGDNAAEAVKELATLASHLGGQAVPTAPAQAEQPKASRSSKPSKNAPKEETPPEADPEEPEDNPSDDLDEEPEISEEVPSVVDLRAKASEIGKTPELKAKIKALLDEFGSKSVSEVPEKKRPAFMKRLEALA